MESQRVSNHERWMILLYDISLDDKRILKVTNTWELLEIIHSPCWHSSRCSMRSSDVSKRFLTGTSSRCNKRRHHLSCSHWHRLRVSPYCDALYLSRWHPRTSPEAAGSTLVQRRFSIVMTPRIWWHSHNNDRPLRCSRRFSKESKPASTSLPRITKLMIEYNQRNCRSLIHPWNMNWRRIWPVR